MENKPKTLLKEGQIVETEFDENMILEDLHGLEDGDGSVLLQDTYNEDSIEEMLEEGVEINVDNKED